MNISSPSLFGSARTASNWTNATQKTADASFEGLLASQSSAVAGSAAAAPTTTTPAVGTMSINDAFKTADADGDGKLSHDEFAKFDDLMHAGGAPRLVEAATGKAVDGNYMFPVIDRSGTGFITMDQVRQHYSDPGRFTGYA